MVLLPDGEKKIEDMFIRFDMIHERDRHTDRQTDGRTDRHCMTPYAALMYSIARQKLSNPYPSFASKSMCYFRIGTMILH